MNNYYQQFINKQKDTEEEKRKERNRKALEYYYKNKDYILERQRTRKHYNQNYYCQWYEKNKYRVQEKRRLKKGGNTISEKPYKPFKQKKPQEPINKKPISFTLTFN